MPAHRALPTEDDVLEAMKGLGTYLDVTPSDALGLFRAAQEQALARLRRAVRVADIMSRPALAFPPDTPLAAAARELAAFAPPGAEGGDAHPSSGPGVSGAPVALKGRVLGVVSVKDIMAALGFARSAPPVALVAAALDGRLGLDGDVAALTVERVMTSPALTAEPAMAAFEAARLMSEAGVRRLPVLEAGRLSGVVTRTDLLRAFGNLL